MQQVKLSLLLFIKHVISILIVGLSLGVTSMFEKLILLCCKIIQGLRLLILLANLCSASYPQP